MKLGITGHQVIADSNVWSWVREEVSQILSTLHPNIIAYTSLADGTDQILAEVVLASGGNIYAIVPFPEYESAFRSKAALDRYRVLLIKAKSVEVLPRKKSNEESFFAAGKRIVEMADILIAVWDGLPAKGLGGTGDVVSYAISLSKKIIHVDPIQRIVKEIHVL